MSGLRSWARRSVRAARGHQHRVSGTLVATLIAALCGGCASAAHPAPFPVGELPQVARGAASLWDPPAEFVAAQTPSPASSSGYAARAVPYGSSALAAAVPGILFDAQAAGDAAASKKDAGAEKPGRANATSLAKQIQNPVANLISVPFENEWNFNAGEHRRTQFIMNAKPVVPQELDDGWIWVHRAIVPLIDQPSLAEGASSRSGLGDITYQGFLNPPVEPGDLSWGVGPAITFPTATDDVLGNDKWSLGPALVLVKTDGPWVVGTLFVNQWQIASQDSDRPRVGHGSFQPFINYNLEAGWYLTTSPIITANWKADKAGDVWTVPVGVGVGRVFHIGEQPINVAVRPYYNVHRADNGSNWSIFFQVTLMFP
jgi:hypothetical protein